MSEKMKTIPLSQPWLPEEYAQIVKDQVLSGFCGPCSQHFGEALAEYVNSQHCLLTVSGTLALSVAAISLGLKPGDEILVPAYGVISTINAFASIGLQPNLVDIDKNTACMSLSQLEATINNRTRAVCFVNFSGYTGSNLLAIQEICQKYNLPLIEDAAGALGQVYQDKYAGTFGTVGIYSFSVPKVITTGQGGALITNNSQVFERAAAYIDQGDLNWRKTNLNHQIGTNLRFTDLQAALGLAQLNDIEKRLKRRRENYKMLQQKLGQYLYAIPGEEAPLHNILFAAQPDELVAFMQAKGINTVRQYRTLSQHPAYKHLAEKEFPNSNYWTDSAVYLPFGTALEKAEIELLADAVLNSGVELYLAKEESLVHS